jgi:hypothetical protein
MTLTMTDVDWQIFRRCYDVDSIEIVDVMMAPAEYLPTAITDPIVAMYGDKTALKGVAGQEVNYRSAKEDINGVYGSVAMDPVRTDFEFNAEGLYGRQCTARWNTWASLLVTQLRLSRVW